LLGYPFLSRYLDVFLWHPTLPFSRAFTKHPSGSFIVSPADFEFVPYSHAERSILGTGSSFMGDDN
jgi:hypothetical protein